MEGTASAGHSKPYKPLTPDSPLNPTILPHVKEPIPPLIVTPPAIGEDCAQIQYSQGASAALLTGLNVLLGERDALANLHNLYATSPAAQDAFQHAVATVATTVRHGGKLVVSGVGKSGKIGQKLVATCNSMQIRAAWLHATEAIHGDMGMIGPNDTILLITFSSNTPELHAFLPHLPAALPLIALTGFDPAVAPCPLFAHRPSNVCRNILLPAPIPIREAAAFGVAAPTTSTTVALALGDALALAVANELHERPAEVFSWFHPGGAIGAANNGSNNNNNSSLVEAGGI